MLMNSIYYVRNYLHAINILLFEELNSSAGKPKLHFIDTESSQVSNLRNQTHCRLFIIMGTEEFKVTSHSTSILKEDLVLNLHL